MNLIVAVDKNWAIGRDGDQLIYIPEDLKHFKALTTGHPVILGRKTLATFPGGRPLKGRRNLILSRDTAYITRIDASFPADKYFPDLDADPRWQIKEISEPMEYEGISFRYYTYTIG